MIPIALLAVLLAAPWRPAAPPYVFAFPRDHAAHAANRTEWWYYTGHLDAGARRFGYELTFFRVGVSRAWESSRSAWAPHTMILGHLALTDVDGRRFRSWQRSGRAALGMAGADTARYRVWIDDWSAALGDDGRAHRLRARGEPFALDLELVPEKPPVAHGARGFSLKSRATGRGSHYYSLTRLATRGRIVVDGDTLAVSGRSWMDHEFGSDAMAGDQVGWDWFSIQLDDGRDLMLYRLRLADGSVEPASSGTLVAPDGSARPLALADFRIAERGRWTSPRSGGVYPSRWRIEVPGAGLSLDLEPVLADQELTAERPGGVTYWEGSVRVSGTSGDRRVAGRGYVELTGYAGRLPDF